MSGNRNGKVYYVCFYAETETEKSIITYPSVISKIDYIVGSLKSLKKEVVVVSIAPSLKGTFPGYFKRIDDLESHVYLCSDAGYSRHERRICFLKHNIEIIKYLIKNVQKEDTVLVYHSLYNRFWLKFLACFMKGKIILQIEDVFSELTEQTSRFKKIEWNLLRNMKKCICVNDIVYRNLPKVEQKVISYGSYLLPPRYDVQPHSTKRLVYAGVIEQERNAAFLAVQAMRFLSEDYELKILGFGSTENIQALELLIKEVNEAMGRNVVSYCGKMTGEEYWKFLQNCDVALSTHAYAPENFASADFTFPSKVLTYMANGLRVVAQRLEVLEVSAVGDYIVFYDEPDPQLIAEAIESIDMNATYDSRTFINKLDETFKKNLKELLGDYY